VIFYTAIICRKILLYPKGEEKTALIITIREQISLGYNIIVIIVSSGYSLEMEFFDVARGK